MVKVTFEQDGRVEDVTSGEFVLAVINTPQKQSDGRENCEQRSQPRGKSNVL